jgi:hypothetical protein
MLDGLELLVKRSALSKPSGLKGNEFEFYHAHRGASSIPVIVF